MKTKIRIRESVKDKLWDSINRSVYHSLRDYSASRLVSSSVDISLYHSVERSVHSSVKSSVSRPIRESINIRL